MDWEKYTGKKNLTPDHRPWEIVSPSAPVEYVDDQTVRFVERGLDDLARNVFGGGRDPLPSFDEVWETIAAELDRKFNGRPLTPSSVCEVVRTSMRIMYETLNTG